MYRNRTAQPTTAQIEAVAASIQAQFPAFTVKANGTGWRMECNTCHESRCHDTAWAVGHGHDAPATPEAPAGYTYVAHVGGFIRNDAVHQYLA